MQENRLIPTPNQWIAQAIAKRQLSQRGLARSLTIDPSQFNRWIQGEEQIPRCYVLELAQHLPPADIKYLLRLKDCEDLCDQLKNRLEAIADDLGVGDELGTAIFLQVADLVSHEQAGGPSAYAEALLRYLTDAVGAALIVQRVSQVGFQESILLPPTVPRFRYPINHFLGTFIDLDAFVSASGRQARAVLDFREQLLNALRRDAIANPSRKKWQDLARQFSIHILARHGSESDRGRVQDLLFASSQPIDPLLRRISFTGVILGGAHPETPDRFLHALQHDRGVEKMNLFFNAFHYGDATFAADGSFPKSMGSFRHAVPHILRHLEHPERYGGILNVEAWTLLKVLETAGAKPFKSILPRLTDLLRTGSPTLKQLDAAVRRQFQRQVSRLLKDES